MVRKLFLLFLVLNSVGIQAQSTDLDRENFKVSYVLLPSEPILDDSKRTYSSNLNGINISGFTRLKSAGTIDLNYKFNGTNVGEMTVEKIKHEKKDKEGNVVSVSYTYRANSSFNSTGTLHVINAITGESYEKSFSASKSYSSNEFDSYYKAERHFTTNKYNLKSSYGSSHRKSIKGDVKSYLNRRYGYVPYNNTNEFFWILGSKKHPEFAKHHEAFDKLKASFEKMNHDQSMDVIKAEVEPVIEYFNSIIPNYPGTKRKMRKVKYASYYNIAKIYYYLDMPEKTLEYAQKLIENDYDKGDGKTFIRKAEDLIKLFETNNMNTRHMEIVTEDLSNVADEEDSEPAAEQTPNIEINKAYLITKENDTILVDIKTEDIATIAYDLKTVEYDDNKSPIGTRVRKAKSCKELLFVDGLHFRNVAFKESSLKGGEVNMDQMLLGGASEKLCKVVYESDKINLYLFNGKEPVIFTPGSKKGKSTLSTGYVFGFKKNLSKLAEGCPTIQEKAKNKEYENTIESLANFCKELTACDGVESSGN